MKITRSTLIALTSSLLVSGAAYAANDDKMPAPTAKIDSYVAPKMSHAPYGAMKIVVPMTTDDKTVQGMKLRNLENSLDMTAKWGGQMQSTVVLYSKGVTLLKNPDPETQKKIDALKSRGVQFVVCDNTLREQEIDFHQLYRVSDHDIVPSGFAEVAFLQTKKHYVVDPIN